MLEYESKIFTYPVLERSTYRLCVHFAYDLLVHSSTRDRIVSSRIFLPLPTLLTYEICSRHSTFALPRKSRIFDAKKQNNNAYVLQVPEMHPT